MIRGKSAGIGCALLLAAAAVATAAEPGGVRDRVRAYRAAHEREILGELTGLLALPNVATKVADVERNADLLTAMLSRRGFAVQRLSAGEGTPPVLYGELTVPGAKRTLMFYAHYDGQPVDQKGWLSDPFKPLLRSGPIGPGTKEVNLAVRHRSARSGAADLRPLGERRQVPHRGHPDRARRAPRRRDHALGQRQAVPGRGGRAGLAPPDGDPAAQRPAARRRRLDALRRAGAPDAADAGLLRRPRRGGARADRLRPDAPAAQRPLRQLGAQPGGDAGASGGEPARRGGSHPDPRLLRRRPAADRDREAGGGRHARRSRSRWRKSSASAAPKAAGRVSRTA